MTEFVLNGAVQKFEGPPGQTALDFLRLQARLTGTKEGCAEGDCGACTIAIGRKHGDGLKFTAVNSCIMLAADLDGCVVLTSEGLSQNGELSSVQRAMVELHGSQCGFCTPGFVMSLFALNQSASVENENEGVLDALAGNLCRCTGYRPILAAAATLHHAPDPRVPKWRAALDTLRQTAETPKTLDDLDAALAATPDAKLTAGTTDIGVSIAKYGHVPAKIVSLRDIVALKTIEASQTHLIIGAMATYSEILPYLDGKFENFATLIRRIGSVQIRNLGTMGGNICNASPIGDSAPCLIALNAVLVLRSAAGEREMPIDEFFTAYRKTALHPGEYLRAIKIPYLNKNEKFFAYKLAKRFDQDISTVSGAFMLRVEEGYITRARAAFGGMAATPLRAIAIEAALAGQPVNDATFDAAATKLHEIVTPISDFRASAGYRLQAASGLLKRLSAQAQDENIPSEIWAL
jgi:xanthine dehydrogenase small subunit